MVINTATRDLIETFEGFVDHWYPDPATKGPPMTCCYGHTDAAGLPHYADDPHRKFTKAEGNAILASDLEKVAASVFHLLTIPLNPNQFGALVSFAFNLGLGNLGKSTLLKKVNAGHFSDVPHEFKKWDKANGKVMAGLTRRRAAEAKLFSTPIGD